VGTSTEPVDELVAPFPDGQFGWLQRPYNQANGVATAHQLAVVRTVRQRDDIDLVHDHVEAIGLAMLAAMEPTATPVLHTLHWDLAKHPELYGAFDGGGRISVNGVSAAQLRRAPRALRAHSIGHVHLATPLAVDAETRPIPDQAEHVVMLGRITPGKGQDLGVRLAHEAGFDLVLAGPVGPYKQPEDLAAALRDPTASANPDVCFWREKVGPLVDGSRVRWVGTLTGAARDNLVAEARVMLAPLRWEEPGGTFVVESLALGTPVVATARGCLPELIEHGRTGLLTTSEEELADLVLAAGKLDPAECRHEAARRFTPAVMAERYVALYEEVAGRPVG
jgi:glycosyltransferase involved in cell wall biosynthesis